MCRTSAIDDSDRSSLLIVDGNDEVVAQYDIGEDGLTTMIEANLRKPRTVICYWRMSQPVLIVLATLWSTKPLNMLAHPRHVSFIEPSPTSP